MKNAMIKMTLMFLACGAVFAQGPRHEMNEDLKYIKDWQRAQGAAEIVGVLQLSSEQVTELKAIKAAVDGVKAEYEPQIEAARTAAEAVFAEVRTNLENSGGLTDEDKAKLKEAKHSVKAVGRDMHIKIKAESVGLKDLLTEEQKAALKAHMQSRREEARGERQEKRGEGQARGERGGKHGEGQGRGERGGKRGGKDHKIARLLLSDHFHAALNN